MVLDDTDNKLLGTMRIISLPVVYGDRTQPREATRLIGWVVRRRWLSTNADDNTGY